MKSPENPLAPQRASPVISVRNFLIALVACYAVAVLIESRTIELEGVGPHGTVHIQVKIRARLNRIGRIVKGERWMRKQVKEIVVRHQDQKGTWSTQDKDLKNIGDWGRRVTKNGWFQISGGCLYLVMDDKNLTSESSSMIIGLPDRDHRDTKMAYWGSAHDQEFDLVWVEK